MVDGNARNQESWLVVDVAGEDDLLLVVDLYWLLLLLLMLLKLLLCRLVYDGTNLMLVLYGSQLNWLLLYDLLLMVSLLKKLLMARLLLLLLLKRLLLNEMLLWDGLLDEDMLLLLEGEEGGERGERGLLLGDEGRGANVDGSLVHDRRHLGGGHQHLELWRGVAYGV